MVKGNEQVVRGEDTAAYESTLVWQPRNVKEAWSSKRKYGVDASFIAGGTLMQLQREQGIPFSRHLISLEKIDELKGIRYMDVEGETKLRIGALTTLTACEQELARHQPWTILAEAARQVASPAVRNRASIGGNVAYQIGDIIPALLALDAEISWFDGTSYHIESLCNYLQKDNIEFEPIVTSFLLPLSPVSSKTMTFYKKVGRREAFIPSLVTVAAYCYWNSENEIEYIRLAAGGGETSPQRFTNCEQFLNGKVLTEDDLGILYEQVMEEFIAEADHFASAHYRKTVAANIIVSEFEKLIY
ncbi:FAD binding domain-containing protein [Halobacillus seohaensis]|uniref:FAD binding domain-containing protein n=1 Tax=Halobacillus seohaensis TaxID=447421 RepID=A0ABW2ES66_9BACI